MSTSNRDGLGGDAASLAERIALTKYGAAAVAYVREARRSAAPSCAEAPADGEALVESARAYVECKRGGGHNGPTCKCGVGVDLLERLADALEAALQARAAAPGMPDHCPPMYRGHKIPALVPCCPIGAECAYHRGLREAARSATERSETQKTTEKAR
jgi:hypothetical protein